MSFGAKGLKKNQIKNHANLVTLNLFFWLECWIPLRRNYLQLDDRANARSLGRAGVTHISTEGCVMPALPRPRAFAWYFLAA